MEIAGIVLAGGKSTRFGTDKAISLFQGKSMLKHSVDLLKQFTDSVLISGDKEEYSVYGYPCIPDLYEGAGPLGGICSCLLQSERNRHVVVTCDMPLVSGDMIDRLIENHCPGSVTVFEDQEGKVYLFPAVFEKGHISILEKQLKEGNNDMKSALKACGYTKVMLNEEDVRCMANINSKDELILLEKSQNE